MSDHRNPELLARAVILSHGHVLLCEHATRHYCYLPGGHVEFGEPARDALARELMEEAGLPIVVGAALLVEEHAFTQNAKPRHEVSMLFAAWPAEGDMSDTDDAPFPVHSLEDGIRFRWHPLDRLHELDLRPASQARWLIRHASEASPPQPLPLLSTFDDAPRRPAVFLDRDGTLIREVHYIREPSQVELIPGAARAIADLQHAGFACVVVSNQSGVARGMLTEADMRAVQREVDAHLAREGVRLDGAYFCTRSPASPDRARVDHPDRKPGPGMLLRAARELHLDLRESWMVGDMLSDILAGIHAGVHATIHVRTGHGGSQPLASQRADFAVDSLAHAAAVILEQTRTTSHA